VRLRRAQQNRTRSHIGDLCHSVIILLMILAIILTITALVLALIATLLTLLVRKGLHNDPRGLALLIVGLLVLQFVLGMLSNLFVTIPDVEPWRVFHYFGPVVLHTLNALCLVVFAVNYAVIVRKASRTMRIAGAVGGIAIVVAFASGVIFVNRGQNDVFSFTMSLGFITALVSYAFAAFSPAPKKIH